MKNKAAAYAKAVTHIEFGMTVAKALKKVGLDPNSYYRMKKIMGADKNVTKPIETITFDRVEIPQDAKSLVEQAMASLYGKVPYKAWIGACDALTDHWEKK